jgi:hypothetical protein
MEVATTMSDEIFSLSTNFTIATTVATVVLVGLLQQYLNFFPNENENGSKGRMPGSQTYVRKRPFLPDLFKEYGPINFRRAYRMKEESFWLLLDLLDKEMGKKLTRRRGKTPNGDICNGMRLAIALRYFAGGDPLDIMMVFKVSRGMVLQCVWIVVAAIHRTKELDLKYPRSYKEQEAVAAEFCKASAVGFNNCAGCIDGILIWIHKPSNKELDKVGFGGRKFYCGRKKKFGLNMQATCDARRRFLDVEIGHPGATSDYLAFVLSSLHQKMENTNDNGGPFLSPGLSLYGDNAYVNTVYMATPFKGASEGPKDAYNFYHSQLRITIECAFGILVHRWGLLRRAMPVNISLMKTIALVVALCKLHNFCIDANEKLDEPAKDDEEDIVLHSGIILPAFQPMPQSEETDVSTEFVYVPERDRLNQLLDGGEHADDHNRYTMDNRSVDQFPNKIMLQLIESQGFQRPHGGKKTR